MLKKVEIVRLKQQNHILSEKAILDEIRHPFIVDMVGYFQDGKVRNVFQYNVPSRLYIEHVGETKALPANFR